MAQPADCSHSRTRWILQTILLSWAQTGTRCWSPCRVPAFCPNGYSRLLALRVPVRFMGCSGPRGTQAMCSRVWGLLGLLVLTTCVQHINAQSAAGQALFSTPGAYIWTAPADVTSVSVLCVGAGGGAGRYVPELGVGAPGNGAGGGGGGATGWINNIRVIPGQSYPLQVGDGGLGLDGSGGDSWFWNSTTLLAGGGRGGIYGAGGTGGAAIVNAAYTSRSARAGGRGGSQSWEASLGDHAGGGGAAGGYGGAGGNGGALGFNPSAGAGGGGGGGFHTATISTRPSSVAVTAGGGGGLGLQGLVAGTGTAGTASALGGRGGSNGPSAGLGNGASPGGGAGGAIRGSQAAFRGGSGACRLIWGAGRSFPNTNTADVLVNPSPPPPPVVVSSPPPPPVVVSSPPPPPVVVSSPPPPPVVLSSPPPPPVVVSSPPPPPVVVSSPPPPPVVVSSPPPPPVVVSSPPPPPVVSGPPGASVGQIMWDQAGTYQWTAPEGVTQVCAVCVGAGGGAGTYVPSLGVGQVNGAAGGGGGGLCWANNIPVTPGTSYTIQVGTGGRGYNTPGTDSFFMDPSTLVARGGAGGTRDGGAGGSWAVSPSLTSRGGSLGGRGGFQSWDAVLGDISGGGGAASGYTGAGGAGGAYPSVPATGGTGGGGGGGYNSTTAAGYGAGVALRGAGPNGAPGTLASPGGKGGSNALDSTTSAAGFGGGAGGLISTTAQIRTGGSGACRIIWGAGRAYPATRTADEVPSATPSPPPAAAALPPPPPPMVAVSPPPPPVVAVSPPPPPVVAVSPPPPPVVVSSPPPPPVVLSSPPPPPVVVSSPPPPPVVLSSPPPPPVVLSSPPPPPVVVSSPPPPPVVVSSPPPPPVVVSSPPPPPVVVSSPPPPPVVVSSPPPPPVAATPPPAGPISTGQVVFGAPGSYLWSPPSGVTTFSLVCIGGGGGAGTYVPSAGPSQIAGAGGGGGGALVWANNIPVTAGASFTIVVGTGGRGNNGKGGDSSLSNAATLLAIARGGAGSNGMNGGIGGSWQLGTVAGGGGAGGTGGFQSYTQAMGDLAGGGGGAGGYTGIGGIGGAATQAAGAGVGGAAGGGFFRKLAAGGGGGTGLLGSGANGAPGNSNLLGGAGGSGGLRGGNETVNSGAFGGGAGGVVGVIFQDKDRVGAPGACRIIFGAGRSYPSTRTADEGTTLATPAPIPIPTPPGPVARPPPPPKRAQLPKIWGGKAFNYQIGQDFQYPQHVQPGVTVYSIDGFNATAEVLSQMKAGGLLPICYVCVGTWEPNRPDSDLFPEAVLGGAYEPPFSVERWLDIRSETVRDLIFRRLQLLKFKGCMAIEPDNTNGYAPEYNQGFPLTKEDWRDYTVWLSERAHELGMYWGLKNSYEMIEKWPELVPQGVWDFAINEECHVYNECRAWILFKNENLPVFQIQYTYNYEPLSEEEAYVKFREEVCPLQATYGLVSVLKPEGLDAFPLYDCR